MSEINGIHISFDIVNEFIPPLRLSENSGFLFGRHIILGFGFTNCVRCCGASLLEFSFRTLSPGYRVSGVWEKMRQFRGSVLRKTS